MTMRYRRFIPALTLLFALGLIRAGEAAMPARSGFRDLYSDTWAATDALGRALRGHRECGPPKKGRVVGIFYFLWLGPHGTDLYDISKLLAANPANPQYGPEGAFHWWGEPQFGYYRSDDEWVIRKHAQMLTDAGVDVVIFDVTNGFTYDDNLLAVCRVFEAVRKAGRATPQITFIANSGSAKVVQRLYDTFYSKNRYPDLWFRWKGKPLILTPEEGLSPEVKAFFTRRHSWAWSDPGGWFGNGKDKWPWIDHYPQKPGWHESPEKPEEVSVCAAQHATTNIGRSFHDGKQPPPDQVTPERGLCFEEQWRRALEVDPEFLFLTGWNEWVAQRFLNKGGVHFLGRALKEGETFFVDQYNQEFSRDLEPMRGGHGDNYYYQMAAGIRRYKGVRPLPKASAAKTIRLDRGFEQWERVRPEYRDDREDTTRRDHPGWGDRRYRNTSGRNDFDVMKVARDKTHLYFYARTREPITEPDGESWMLLLLNADGDPKTGWEGYDYLVNRRRKGDDTAVLERNVGGKWAWEPVTEVELRREGNEIHLAISRSELGLEAGKGKLALEFKWADNVPASGDILDFIDQGDVAPNGRFNYRYEE